ncbi:MAG: wax ester/triacylglycerol synthase family O-acyltransferase [Gammaproteobacteria bacterium]|nr:wax ester/triacylglycerol synthase family O-acyltransferase [Gammaproteobacteria bacterium]MCP5459973.1 wax ester/triacylglycerol synthase family O-acyltransferase [Gammaproteobacteria bacterium]
MSSIDTAWLRMDRPYNLMMITSVMVFEDRLTLDALRQTIATLFLSHRRFKQKPVHHAGGFYWETDPHFTLNSHVRRIGLAGNGGKKELEELVSDLMSTPLDPSKPLWQYYLVEDYQGGSALIGRIHHCYADGIALIHVLLSMTTMSPTEQVTHTPIPTALPKHRRNAEHKGEGGIFELLFHPLEAVDNAVKAGQHLLEEGMEVVRHAPDLPGYAKQGVGLLSEAAKLLVMADDPSTLFKGKPGVSKRVAWIEPLPLAEVKAIGKALNCSINDVLLSCVAGALRAYLADQGECVEGLEIRATVPVNLRPLDKAHNLGNFFGLVFLTLPIGIEDPLTRLFEVKERMEQLKGSYQAILALGLLGTLGLSPKIVQASAIKILSKKATAVMTNVPGPQMPLYFAGAKVREMMFWVPQSGSIGMGVSILTYNGFVQFGLITDSNMVDDPESVISRFGREFENLLLTTIMEPWGETLDTDA